MRFLAESETADYLAAAIIEQSIDEEHAIIHTGTAYGGDGCRVVLINDCNGQTVLTESL